jgi:hypothetical protein
VTQRHLLGKAGADKVSELLRRGALEIGFDLRVQLDPVLDLMRKYRDVPASVADACIVRMTEIEADVTVLTTDRDFPIYRRHGRQVIPAAMPP